MSSFIKLTPLSGAKDENFLCYLLEIDQIKILLDCGWSEQFDVAQLESLEKVAKHIDAVLISHADLPHIGAYPYAVAKFGLACPVYVTTPVHDMGQACLIDAVKSQREFQDFTTFSLTDINEAMSKMTLLRYSQPFSLQGKCQGISVTPFGAGHTIGGTIWKIKKDSENIVYTVDYNHRKERHLNGSELMTTEILSKPTLLITDTLNALMPNPPPRKERDRNLISICMETLQASGNVLIPVESTTRVLELAYLLDQHWAFNRVHYHLVFLTHQSQKTITLARSMLEWMGDGISQAFAARELPFDFRSLKNLTSMGELEALVGPKVVLTSFPGMEFGYSKHMLLKWASDPGNTVILPEKGPAGSLSRKLYDFWRETSPSDSPLRSPVQMNFDIEVEVNRELIE